MNWCQSWCQEIWICEWKQCSLRTDDNSALFVSLNKPHSRLTESGVELRLREMGKKLGVEKVHPHKFRRTMATRAIEKGMSIEQMQKIL